MNLFRTIVVSLILAATGCGGEAPADNTEAEASKTEAEPEKPAPSEAKSATTSSAGATTAASADTQLPEGHHPALLDPSQAKEPAPDVFKAKFETTKGDFVITAHKDWAPKGAERFYNLVRVGYYDNVAFFRAIDGFMVQFGISGYPQVNDKWREARIPDDPVVKSNTRGFVSFAMAGPNTRTTQVFINYVDRNSKLDGMGFAPFGEVTEGMDVVDALHKGYGEGAPRGRGPDQGRIQKLGNAYLKESFPELDYVKKASIVE